MRSITFTVPGVPVGKQRAGRHTTTTTDTTGVTRSQTRSFTPSATKNYEELVASWARISRVELIEGPVEIGIAILRTIPPSWSKRKRDAARAERYATGKPDIDNVVKSILDALSGIAYRDDTKVAKLAVVRLWGLKDSVDITVGPAQRDGATVA